MFQGDEPTGTMSLKNGVKHAAFWLVHLGCLGIFFTGFSWLAVTLCVALYLVRMFAITGGYHRYFSHKTYKTSRVFQFLMGFLGGSAAQKGPIWWASHHRHHHVYSDQPEDCHSPIVSGIWFAHVGWVLSSDFVHTRWELVKDLARFPELRWLDRWYMLPPLVLAMGVYGLGELLAGMYPQLQTSGWQLLFWGFFLSTVLVYHGTFCINSFTHLFGKQRFETGDHSRNNLLLALITLGEGWHNNHHYYPAAARQGMYWWEIDITYYVLKLFSRLGLVWDLRPYAAQVYNTAATGLKKAA